MPQRKTAKKELRKSAKRKIRNLSVKSKVKSAIKRFKKNIKADPESFKTELSHVYKTLDMAASKKVIHKNKAARKKSRLSRMSSDKPSAS